MITLFKRKNTIFLSLVLSFIIAFSSCNFVYAMENYKVNIKFNTIKNTSDGVKITWAANKKVDYYNIYRKTDDGKWTKIKKKSTTTFFLDDSTSVGHIYTYAVEANRNGRVSDKIICNKTIKGAPDSVEDVNCKFAGVNKIKISWNPDYSVSGYYIYRSFDKKKWKIIATITNEAKKSYVDTVDESGKCCYYKVIPYTIVEGVEYVGTLDVKPIGAKSVKGIDVSYHNGTIDWAKVKKAGIEFAFIRVGYGDASKSSGGVLDPQFKRNVKNARKNGIDIGIYLYSTANNVEQAKKEAKFLLKCIKGYGDFEYPIVYDFESEFRKYYRCKTENTQMVQAFYKIVSDAGYNVTVYSDHNMLSRYLNYNKIKSYGSWMAYWTYDTNNYPPSKLDNVMFWQYSDKGRVNGIPEDVDLNLRFVTGKDLSTNSKNK